MTKRVSNPVPVGVRRPPQPPAPPMPKERLVGTFSQSNIDAAVRRENEACAQVSDDLSPVAATAIRSRMKDKTNG